MENYKVLNTEKDLCVFVSISDFGLQTEDCILSVHLEASEGIVVFEHGKADNKASGARPSSHDCTCKGRGSVMVFLCYAYLRKL